MIVEERTEGGMRRQEEREEWVEEPWTLDARTAGRMGRRGEGVGGPWTYALQDGRRRDALLHGAVHLVLHGSGVLGEAVETLAPLLGVDELLAPSHLGRQRSRPGRGGSGGGGRGKTEKDQSSN